MRYKAGVRERAKKMERIGAQSKAERARNRIERKDEDICNPEESSEELDAFIDRKKMEEKQLLDFQMNNRSSE